MRSVLPLETTAVSLRPPSPDTFQALYEMATSGRLDWRWAGAETPDAFRASLWDGVLVQYEIQHRQSGARAGLVTARDANLFHRYAHLGITLLPGVADEEWPVDGVLLFLNYVFVKFDLRRIYVESAAPQIDVASAALNALFDVEGRMRGRVVEQGRERDVFVLTLTRERWLDKGVEVLERSVATPIVMPGTGAGPPSLMGLA